MNSFAEWKSIVRHFAALSIATLCLAYVTTRAQAESESKNIVGTAVAAGNFETLVAAVKAAKLAETLSGDGPFTVFAPTDKAFARLPEGTLETLLEPENGNQLRAILAFHVVAGRVTARDAFSLDSAATVNGQRVTISRRDGKLSIGGASIVAADIECSNGVIHIIDEVLIPQDSRIPAVAEDAGQFGTLIAAATKVGLLPVLNGDGPFTVFAPTDAAFTKLPEGTVDSLLAEGNRDKLIAILKYHVIPGRVYADQAVASRRAKTLQGGMVKVSVKAEGLLVNDALVTKPDVETANGVVHIIDSVLLPQPFGRQQAMTTLHDAIRRGVPIFNAGHHDRCAEIYASACQTIVDAANAELPHDVTSQLQHALDRADSMNHATSRAWALRHGMDSALTALNRMTLETGGLDTSSENFLYSFNSPDAASQWRTTNDDVMGGRSDGRFKISEEGSLTFFGTLSLANNGGFASVRSVGSNLGLTEGDMLVARVRGDGRKYSFSLYTPSRRIAFSYRAEFQTAKDKWVEVFLPLDDFVATSFGRVVQNEQLEPSDVNGLGILLGDKQAGPFQLEVDWIKKVESTN